MKMQYDLVCFTFHGAPYYATGNYCRWCVFFSTVSDVVALERFPPGLDDPRTSPSKDI
jgi:hypothetical protein